MSEKGMLDNLIETTKGLTEKIQMIIIGEEKDETVDGFSNMMDFNNTCMLITMIFIVIFVYTKEFLQFLNKNLNIKL